MGPLPALVFAATLASPVQAGVPRPPRAQVPATAEPDIGEDNDTDDELDGDPLRDDPVLGDGGLDDEPVVPGRVPRAADETEVPGPPVDEAPLRQEPAAPAAPADPTAPRS